MSEHFEVLPQAAWDLVESWYGNGYAGAMGWHYDEASSQELDAMKAFADGQVCETRY